MDNGESIKNAFQEGYALGLELGKLQGRAELLVEQSERLTGQIDASIKTFAAGVKTERQPLIKGYEYLEAA